MKKVMNQKVKLSKTAKKVLAGVLAASMVFSGTMTSFVTTPETVNAEEAATKEAATVLGLEIVSDNKDNNGAEIVSIDRRDAVLFGKPKTTVTEDEDTGEEVTTVAELKGIEVKNPFAGKSELSESYETALKKGIEQDGPFNGVITNSSRDDKGANYIVTKGYYFNGFKTEDKNVDGNIVKQIKFNNFGEELLVNKDAAIKVYNKSRDNMLAASLEAISYLKAIEENSPAGIHFEFDLGMTAFCQAIADAATGVAELEPEDIPIVHEGAHRNDSAKTAEGKVNTNPGDPAEIEGEFNYPMPVWSTGVTISTWVKVPESAEYSAPIFTFMDTSKASGKFNGLTLRTDGQFMFGSYVQTNGKAAANCMYSAEFQGGTPYDNKGKWVYVTLTLKNDEAHVYYNGVKATEIINPKQTAVNNNGSKNLNAGFGIVAQGTIEKRVEHMLNKQTYPQLFSHITEPGTVDVTDVNSYSVNISSNWATIMQVLTDENTKLYLGGTVDGETGAFHTANRGNIFISVNGSNTKTQQYPDGTNATYGGYSKYSAGMMLDNLTTVDRIMTADEVVSAYAVEAEAVADEWVEIILEENEAIAKDKAAAKAAIEAAKLAETAKLAEAEVQIAKDINEVSLSAADAEGASATIEDGIITMDRLFGVTGDAIGTGVLVDNPFAGKYELAESLYDALSGSAVNALTSHIDGKGTGLYMHLKTAEFKGFKTSDIKEKVKDADGKEIEVVVGQKIQFDAPEKDAILSKDTAIAAYEKAQADMLAATADATRVINLKAVSPEWYQWENTRVEDIAKKIVAQDIKEEDVIFTYEGARSIGVLNHETDENPDPYSIDGEVSYPLPTWTKGVTISTWVKVKKGTAWSAPIFSFGNGKDGMVLRTDGTFIFAGEVDTDEENKKLYNNYVADFQGYTPYDNQDTWVHVTLTVMNDDVHVYYNGEEAKQVLNKNITKSGKNGSKELNGGFGIKAHGSDSDRIKSLVGDAKYPQLLQNFKSGDTDFTNIANYSTSTRMLMMDLLTNPATELYLGGDNGTTLHTNPGAWCITDRNLDSFCPLYYDGLNWSTESMAWAKATEFSSGLKIANFSTLDYVVDATEAKALFNIQESRDYIKTETDYSELKTSKHINKMNEDQNNSKVEKANVNGTEMNVITLGKINTDEYDWAAGVELVNPFKGKTDLVEDLTTGFKNSGQTFKGLTYTITKDVYGDLDGDGVNEKNPIDQETYLQVATNMNTFAGFRYTYYFLCNFIDGKEKNGGEYWPGNDPNGKKDVYTIDGEGLTRTSIQDKAAFVTKEDALYAYNTARNFLIDNNYIGANGVAQQWLDKVGAEGSAIKGYHNDDPIVSEYAVKLASIEKPEDLTPSSVQYIYEGAARNPEGNLTDITKFEGEFSYPMPKWNKGVTISTWVKVPETATFSTPIYTFANSGGLDGLTLRTDGTVMYLGDGVGSGEEKNYFVANYAGETPFDNKGEWVYVTLTIKNDEFKVYYNGKRATEKISTQFEGAGKNAGQGFNFGFGYSNIEDKLKYMLLSDGNPYVDMLKNFEVGTTDFSDVTKYNITYDNTSIMEFITKNSTKLYVGGYTKSIYSDNGRIMDVDKVVTDPTTGMNVAWGGYSSYAEGMQVGGFAFETKVLTDSEARMLYNDLFLPDETDVPYPSIDPNATEDPNPTAGTGATEDPNPTAGTGATEDPNPTAGTGATEDPNPTAGTGATDAPKPTDGTVNPSESAPTSETPVASTTPTETPVKLGDGDENGVVELADAQLTLKIALLIIKDATPAQMKACDVDGNGAVELADAQAVLKEALKITENFKPKK